METWETCACVRREVGIREAVSQIRTGASCAGVIPDWRVTVTIKMTLRYTLHTHTTKENAIDAGALFKGRV